MRSINVISLVVFVVFWILPASTFSLEFIYPADKTFVVRSNYLIVKGGAESVLDGVMVEVNGVASDIIDIGSEEYKATFADFLILEPEWAKGKNIVTIKGFVDGKPVVSKTADIYFSPVSDPVRLIPGEYKPFVMHTRSNEALCAPCHNMQPDTGQLKNSAAKNNPCGSCHQRMLEQPFVHGPEGVFQCIDCHDSKNTDPRWQVTKAEKVLCGECHIDKMDEYLQNPFVHGPVAVGHCITCHDPHASGEPAQLNAPINSLCTECHGTVKEGEHVVRGSKKAGHPLSKSKDPLNPERSMSCVSCHNPHSGKSSDLFVRNLSGRFSLCQECHKK